jgi:5-methyltetrahydropteroyltriglutamate--homocysteine methyltransferase
MKTEFPRGAVGAPGHACVGPIRYQGHESIRRNIRDLKAALDASGVKEGFLTAVAPASTGYDSTNEYYREEREYVFAIAEALREEYLEIVNSGLVLQVDDAVLANMYDELVQQGPEHYRRWAELRVEALNHALRGIPEDRIRYHVCFGSWHVPHVSDAPLGAIVDLMLAVRAGAYSIESANVRHEHEWRVWETVKLPSGKILIPGVVTHHTTTVEHPRLVADRIVRFANIVGRENVIAGTDCGFAQTEALKRVHPQVMWAKLSALAEGARIATRELWGSSAE